MLIAQYDGTNWLKFCYSADGEIVGFSCNYDAYYFAKNAQGDIIGILDTGSEFVCTYEYDAWGNCTVYDSSDVVNTSSTFIGNINPIRYRGYYYDAETSLYYVSSRYYEPEFGRFLNSDTTDVITASVGNPGYDKNLYAYCDNNPVIRIDITGYAWETIFDVISLASSIADVAINPSDPWAWAGLVGDTIDLIPFVTGVGETTKAVKLIKRVDDVVDTTRKVKVHGNSLKTTKETIGYVLRKTDTGEIMKFGETTRGTKRYTQKFYREKGVFMEPLAYGSKYDMHYWQHYQILNYYNKNGHKPPWNKSFW